MRHSLRHAAAGVSFNPRRVRADTYGGGKTGKRRTHDRAVAQRITHAKRRSGGGGLSLPVSEKRRRRTDPVFM